MLFNRLQAELLPAIEIVLAGYDAMVGRFNAQDLHRPRVASGPMTESEIDERKRLVDVGRQYGLLAVWVLQSFAHMLGGLISIPTMDSNVLANFREIVRLAMTVARVSRFGDEGLYGQPVASPWAASGQQTRLSYYSAFVERGRRAWWGIVSIDNLFAAMHGTDPVIPWQEFTHIKMSATDVIYQALSGEIDGTEVGGTGTASFWSTGKISTPDAANLPEGSVVAFEPMANWSLAPIPNTTGTRPILTTSIVADGAFSPQTAAVRIAQINAQISAYRRRRISLWQKDATRSYLLDHLASWYGEVPQTFKMVDMIQATVSRPIPAGVGTLVYLTLMYLSGMISLNAPADEALWSGEADEGWIQNEASVQARLYADKVTDLITPLVLEEATIPQMGLPVSLLHAELPSFLSASNIPRDSSFNTPSFVQASSTSSRSRTWTWRARIASLWNLSPRSWQSMPAHCGKDRVRWERENGPAGGGPCGFRSQA
jgi:hypothetical protein